MKEGKQKKERWGEQKGNMKEMEGRKKRRLARKKKAHSRQKSLHMLITEALCDERDCRGSVVSGLTCQDICSGSAASRRRINCFHPVRLCGGPSLIEMGTRQFSECSSNCQGGTSDEEGNWSSYLVMW